MTFNSILSFYRADETRQGDGTPSGLGLAIARTITELHGGMTSASSNLGEGTTITITLPAPILAIYTKPDIIGP